MYLFDGTENIKNIALEQYPPAAWTFYNGNTEDDETERKYYQEIAWIYRCVQLRANSVAALPWTIKRGDKEIWASDEEVPESLTWLQDLSLLLWLSEAATTIGAEAFWFKVQNRSRILGLQWLAPMSMIPQWSETVGLTKYKRLLGDGKSKFLDVDDVIYFCLPNPLHETKPGTSPMQAAAQAANILYSVDQFSEKFFKRGAIKATLLTVDGNPPKPELDKLEAWWKRFFSGVENAWETAAVRAGVKPVVVGEGLESLHGGTLTNERRQDIATALGVPASMLMANAANYATAEADRLNFYETTVIPSANFLANIINRQLLKPLDYMLKFNPQELSLFQEDEEQRSAAVKNLVDAKMPLEMALAILGYHIPDGMELPPPMPEIPSVIMQPRQLPGPPQNGNGMQPEQPMAMQRSVDIERFKRWARNREDPDPAQYSTTVLTEADKAAILAEMQGDGAPAMLPFRLPGRITPDTYKAMILQLDPDDDEAEQKVRMEIERQSTERIRRAMEADRRAIASSVQRLNGMADFPEWASTDLEKTLRRGEPGRDELYDALRRMLQQSVDLGVSVAVDQLETVGFGFDWTLTNEHAVQWVNGYTSELFDAVNGTTRRTVRESVREWVENGEPLSALVDELEPVFGAKRAELIASTEVTRAYAEANRIAYRESGIVDEMEWRTANDERVCPICGPLHGQRAPIDGQFDGGFSAPPAHPRCRCWPVPVISTPGERRQ